ncbi:MAG TPA: LysE family translocator [Gemmatimonadales bacterium]|nr:LysE family translocator [Gemmatimonadales bacterium]
MTPVQAALGFTGVAAVLTITPGLDTALVLRTAAVEGPRRALLAGAGICLGCLVWGLAASAGIGALVAASSAGFEVLRWAGAAYLLYLGGRLLLRPSLGQFPDARAPGPASPGGWFLRGLLTNLLNPKVAVFYATLLPQFVPPGVPATPFSMLLAGIHAAEGIIWFGVVVAATRQLSVWLSRPRVTAWLDRATGLLLLGFGLGLVLERSR